ncbi:testin [Genypterus blacodes]|uniref:testin n=1 Tax=Genypterus blacodes TaxID=154954 RepID=UPI003F76AF25
MEIERELKKVTLGHEFGAGAPCLKCQDRCEGFELHFWRKICRNCKCSLTEHDVLMNSEENKKVGKLFEDTKYTGLIAKLKTDGVPTYRGNMVTISMPATAMAQVVPPRAAAANAVPPKAAAASAVAPSGSASAVAPGTAAKPGVRAQAAAAAAYVTPVKADAVPVVMGTTSASVVPVPKDVPMKSVTYEWAPRVPNQCLAVRYIQLLPPEKRPVVGSEGAVYRRQQMARQLPEHDQDPAKCHELSPNEVKQMEQFVRKYKDEALGVGDIRLPEEMALAQAGGAAGGVAGGAAGGPAGGPAGGAAGGAAGRPAGGPAGGAAGGPAGGPAGVGAAAGGAGGPRAGFVPGAVGAGAAAGGMGAGYKPEVGRVGAGVGPGAAGAGAAGGPGAAAGWRPGTQGDLGTAATAGAMGGPGGQQAGPQKTYSCHHCQQPMGLGDPAVFAERAGLDKLWHPACFVCCTCSELLVDMIYFWKKGKLYCGRHYGDSEKPRCGGCDELIFSNEYTQAEEQSWHLKHFCCFDCDCILAGETYVMENDKPVCKPCYMSNYAVKCSACQSAVEPEAQRVSFGEHHWHAEPQCFQCSGCSKGLMGERFMAVQARLFCSVECKKKTTA